MAQNLRQYPIQRVNRASTPPRTAMTRAVTTAAVEIVVEALLLRKAHPSWPAVDVLDQVMRARYGQRIDFGDLAKPPAPFAILVADAFDGGMLASDWEGLWQFNGHGELRPFLLQLFGDEVWPKFVVRYSLY